MSQKLKQEHELYVIQEGMEMLGAKMVIDAKALGRTVHPNPINAESCERLDELMRAADAMKTLVAQFRSNLADFAKGSVRDAA